MSEKVCKTCKHCSVIVGKDNFGHCAHALNSHGVFVDLEDLACSYWEEKKKVDLDTFCSGYKYIKIKVTSESGATCKVPEINMVNIHVGYCSVCRRAYGLTGSSEESNYKYCPYCGVELKEFTKP